MSAPSNMTTAATEAIIQEAYQNYIYNLVFISALALLFYTTVLNLSSEVEYMWAKSFSLPALLYFFTRYAGLASHGFSFGVNFLPLGRACNVIANVGNAMTILAYIGIQGLLITRTYALCQGNKVVAGALVSVFLAGLGIDLFGVIKFNGCVVGVTSEEFVSNLVVNILTIIVDVIVFGTCLWKVWGTWKLRRETNSRRSSHGSHDFVSILFKQVISRFCFVVVTTVIGTILQPFVNSSLVLELEFYQQVLSVILIADFTLDLRRHNSAAIDANHDENGSVSVIQFRSALNNIHQTILVEMGEQNGLVDRRAGSDDGISEFPDDTEPACEPSSDRTTVSVYV